MKTVTELLKDNTYPGRGIIAGLSEDGQSAVAAYFIMGRSENSRNRVFEKRGDEIYTAPFDESKVEDPSLIIYTVLTQVNNKLIFTNGDQTDTIAEFIKTGKTVEEALFTRCFEPDKPNYTPRISAVVDLKTAAAQLSILKAADESGSGCDRHFFNYSPVKGEGRLIHTYKCDGNPIPSFEGEPKQLKIGNDIDGFANEIWSALNEGNKISLYVRYVSLESGEYTDRLINKNR